MRMDKPGTETGKKEGPTCSGGHRRAVTCNGFDTTEVRRLSQRAPDRALQRKLLVMLPREIFCLVVHIG